MVEQAGYDDVRTADQPHALAATLAGEVKHVKHSRPAGVDHGARRILRAIACADAPDALRPLKTGNRRMRQDGCPSISRIAQVKHDHAGIVDPAIRIGKGGAETMFQRLSSLMCPQVKRTGRRQLSAAANMVVKEQTKP